MKDIIFRGKRVDNGEWVEGGLLYSGNDCFIVERIMFRNDKNNCSVAENYKVIPKTVGMWYGEYYKGTDRKIFSGDRIKMWNGNKTFIIYENSYWRVGKNKRIIDYYEWKDFVCIGDIHDNPELLKDLQ